MTDPTVTETGGYCVLLAAELYRIADDLAQVAHHELPEPRSVNLWIQPGGTTDDEVMAAVDVLGAALLGQRGHAEQMHDDIYHYRTEGKRGAISSLIVHRAIDGTRAEQMKAATELAAKVAELAVLRAEVQQMRAAAALTPDADPLIGDLVEIVHWRTGSLLDPRIACGAESGPFTQHRNKVTCPACLAAGPPS